MELFLDEIFEDRFFYRSSFSTLPLTSPSPSASPSPLSANLDLKEAQHGSWLFAVPLEIAKLILGECPLDDLLRLLEANKVLRATILSENLIRKRASIDLEYLFKVLPLEYDFSSLPARLAFRTLYAVGSKLDPALNPFGSPSSIGSLMNSVMETLPNRPLLATTDLVFFARRLANRHVSTDYLLFVKIFAGKVTIHGIIETMGRTFPGREDSLSLNLSMRVRIVENCLAVLNNVPSNIPEIESHVSYDISNDDFQIFLNSFMIYPQEVIQHMVPLCWYYNVQRFDFQRREDVFEMKESVEGIFGTVDLIVRSVLLCPNRSTLIEEACYTLDCMVSWGLDTQNLVDSGIFEIAYEFAKGYGLNQDLQTCYRIIKLFRLAFFDHFVPGMNVSDILPGGNSASTLAALCFDWLEKLIRIPAPQEDFPRRIYLELAKTLLRFQIEGSEDISTRFLALETEIIAWTNGLKDHRLSVVSSTSFDMVHQRMDRF